MIWHFTLAQEGHPPSESSVITAVRDSCMYLCMQKSHMNSRQPWLLFNALKFVPDVQYLTSQHRAGKKAKNEKSEITLSYWVGVVLSKPQDKENTYLVDFSEMLSSSCSSPITVFCSKCLYFNPSFVSWGDGFMGARAGVSDPTLNILMRRHTKKAHLAFAVIQNGVVSY